VYNKRWAKKLNVFNSTSFASKALIYALKKVEAREPAVTTKPLMEAEIVTDLMKDLVERSQPIE